MEVSPSSFDPSALQIFRTFYPNGQSYVVPPSGDPAYPKQFGELEIQACTPTELGRAMLVMIAFTLL